MATSTAWSIRGAAGEAIPGDTHMPGSKASGVVLIAHGFKGYKDYGFIPRLAAMVASAGFVVHRFNFSHSGMTSETATFARPDLFERDTWNKQLFDLRKVIEAVGSGRIAGKELPLILLGHSRGGVTAILTAGRLASDASFLQPAGVIAVASPASCQPFAREDVELLLRQGYLESPSARTGQRLRIGRAFIQEQLDDPMSHDLTKLIGAIQCPILLVHGDADDAVPCRCAFKLALASRGNAEVALVPGGNHVFNCPNPMPGAHPVGGPLLMLIGEVVRFAQRATNPSRAR